MSADTPSLADVIRMHIDAFAGAVHTSLPGYVISYDRATQTADIQPAVRGRVMDAAGEIAEEDLPPLRGVPVQFFSGSLAAFTFDLSAGDPVLIVFAERAIDIWKGQAPGQVVSTNEPRRFDLSDAYAIPGGRPPSSPLAATDFANGAAVLRSLDIRLGSSAASDYVALASLVASAFSTLKTWLDTHFHTSAAAGSPTTPPTVPSPTAASVAATRVKAQ